MIVFTHLFDLFSKILSVVAVGSILIGSGTADWIDGYSVHTPSPTLTFILSALVFWSLYHGLIHRRTIDVFSTLLFVRTKFGIWSTWNQAYLLRRLFCPGILGFSSHWYPMDNVMQLEKNERLTILLKFALSLKEDRMDSNSRSS